MRLTEQEVDDLKPGTIRYLNPGETVDFADEPRAGTLPELCRSYKRNIRRAKLRRACSIAVAGAMVGGGIARVSTNWLGLSGWQAGGWFGLAMLMVGALALLFEILKVE